jgi:hypothetical protein
MILLLSFEAFLDSDTGVQGQLYADCTVNADIPGEASDGGEV